MLPWIGSVQGSMKVTLLHPALAWEVALTSMFVVILPAMSTFLSDCQLLFMTFPFSTLSTIFSLPTLLRAHDEPGSTRQRRRRLRRRCGYGGGMIYS